VEFLEDILKGPGNHSVCANKVLNPDGEIRNRGVVLNVDQNLVAHLRLSSSDQRDQAAGQIATPV
jgi:hypothetical protein